MSRGSDSALKRRISAGLAAVLAVAVALCLAVPVGKAIAASTDSVVAFSSDAHNTSGNNAADRASSWIDAIEKSLGEMDYMGFTGDCGNAGATESDFWKYTEKLITAVNAKTTGIFTTGNHEWSPGNFGSTSSTVKSYYTRIGEAADKGNYSIYCFGAASSSQKISTEDIATLKAYLEAEGKSKPIFILCHYPLHDAGSTYYGRSTTNASQVIDLLNEYPNVIYLWGHNHTLVGSGEEHYDQIFTGSIDDTEINFTYAAAGCMSDSDYSSSSAQVDGKGLVAKVAADGKTTTLQYYDESGKAIGTAITVKTAGGSTTPTSSNAKKTSTIEAGKKYVIVSSKKALTTTTHSGYSNSSGYKYSGFAGADVTISSSYITSAVTDDMIWTAGGTSGAYTFTNGGKYLNATYVSNGSGSSSGSTGTLKLDSTSDTWSYSDSKLQSANSDKYLTWDTTSVSSSGSGSSNLFTVRSSSSASTIEFYEVTAGSSDPSGDVKIEKADLAAGRFVIVSGDAGKALNATAHEGYKNSSSYTYTGLAGTDVTVASDAITSKVTSDMVWDVTVSGSAYTFVNEYTGKTLNATYSSSSPRGGALLCNDTADTWTVSSNKLTSANSSRILTWDTTSSVSSGSSNLFTVRSSSSSLAQTMTFYQVPKDAKISGPGGSATLDKIEITAQPTKLSYTVGEELDTTGMVVTATYSDKSTDDVTADVTVSGFDGTKAGTQTITVAYEGKKASFDVTVAEKQIGNLTKVDAPEAGKTYIIVMNGKAMGATAGSVKAKSGSSKVYEGFEGESVTIASGAISTSSKLYKDMAWTFEADDDEFKVKNYDKGTYLYIAGGSSTNELSLETSGSTWGYNADDQKLYKSGSESSMFISLHEDSGLFISYSSLTPALEFYIVTDASVLADRAAAPTLDKIEVTTQPTKLSYTVGEELDTTGMVVTATYSDESSTDVTANVTVSGYDGTKTGTQTITVAYEGKSDSFDVTVAEKVYANLEKVDAPKAGKTYIIVMNGKAMGATAGSVKAKSGSDKVYEGFAGEDVTIASGAISTTSTLYKDMAWTFEADDDEFLVKNYGEGTYLYTKSGSSTNELSLETSGSTWGYNADDQKLYKSGSESSSFIALHEDSNLFISYSSLTPALEFYIVTDASVLVDRPEPAVVDLTGVTFESDTVVYSGATQNILAEGVPADVAVAYTVAGEPFSGAIAAGSYEITATFTKAGFNSATMTATLTINKATYDMSGISFTDSAVSYNGQAQSLAITGELPAGVAVTYEGNGQVKAGVYTVTAKFTGDADNYNAIDNMTATLTVSKAIYDMTGISLASATFACDGESHSLAIAGELPEGVSVSYTGNNQSEPGIYTVVATFAGDADNYYAIEDISTIMTITSDPATFVKRLYRELLKVSKPSDYQMEYWMDKLDNGATAVDIIKGFTDSKAFANAGMNNEKKVRALYAAMLGQANPAQDQVTYWAGRLAPGYSVHMLIEDFARTEDFANQCNLFCLDASFTPESDPGVLVRRLYQVVLLVDEPTQAQINDITAKMYAGTSVVDIIKEFFDSATFTEAGYTVEQQVCLLYKAILNQDNPTDDQVAYWTNRMNSGFTVRMVIEGFANTAAFGVECESCGVDPSYESEFTAKEYVKRLYKDILGNETPGYTQLNYWSGKLKSGMGALDVVDGFLDSEAFVKAGYSNEQKIRILYGAMLGNYNPTNEQLSWWATKLYTGSSIHEVAAGFAESSAFIAECQAYGIQRVTVK